MGCLWDNFKQKHKFFLSVPIDPSPFSFISFSLFRTLPFGCVVDFLYSCLRGLVVLKFFLHMLFSLFLFYLTYAAQSERAKPVFVLSLLVKGFEFFGYVLHVFLSGF